MRLPEFLLCGAGPTVDTISPSPPVPPRSTLMKRRILLALASVAVVLTVMGLSSQQPRTLLVLEWAAKAPPETPPVAVLIELGVGDTKLAKGRDWSASATVTGAKVVHREGYRFRSAEGDKLLEGNAWQA